MGKPAHDRGRHADVGALTGSYTANRAALALIALHAGQSTGRDMSELGEALDKLPESIASILMREGEVYFLLHHLHDCPEPRPLEELVCHV